MESAQGEGFVSVGLLPGGETGRFGAYRNGRSFSKQECLAGSVWLIRVDNQIVVILCDFGMAFGL